MTRVHLVFIIFFVVSFGTIQAEEGKVSPQTASLPIEEGAITVVHLSPGYTTSVRLPEAVNSVVIGNPASFKAEHSELEPRLVFLKPISLQPAESNAMITTKSGQEISLHLISAGQVALNARVDFVVEYRRAHSVLITSPEAPSFLVAETQPVADSGDPPARMEKPDVIARALSKQEGTAPQWQGKELLASIGESSRHSRQTVVGFSVLNDSQKAIELLPPQIELSGGAGRGKGKRIKAEPVAIADFRMTRRRLEPGERADGVVVFERPPFKESSEKLQLQVAEAGRVDRPILLPIPFTPSNDGGGQ